MCVTADKVPILVAVDFSPYSEAALLKAGEFAECMNAPLIALHVVHDPAEMPGYYSKLAKNDQLLRIEDLAKQMFDTFIERIKEKYPDAVALQSLQTMLVVGLPVTKILQVVEKVQPQMLVMGSQGLTGLKHIMLGSKAEQMVKLCPVPITIVKQTDE